MPYLEIVKLFRIFECLIGASEKGRFINFFRAPPRSLRGSLSMDSTEVADLFRRPHRSHFFSSTPFVSAFIVSSKEHTFCVRS